MDNRKPHNHNAQQLYEHPFVHILKGALLHIDDRNIDTVQHRSATPEYRITIEHGSIRIGQECAASMPSVRR